MAGTSLKHFRFFEKLCGKDFTNIVLTTTMWGDVDEQLGAMREKELESEYWRPMVERGSPIKRFYYTRESALEILAPIFDEVHKRSSLLLQTEVNEHGIQLKDTSAGKVLYTQPEELVLHKVSSAGRDKLVSNLFSVFHDSLYSPSSNPLASKSKAKVPKVDRELREERESESKDRKKRDLLLGKNTGKSNEDLCQDTREQKKSEEVKFTATTWVDTDDRRLWVPRAMQLESSREMSHASGKMPELRMEKVKQSDLYMTLEREKRIWKQRAKERENMEDMLHIRK